MLLRLSPTDPEPLYRQISTQVQRALQTGELNVGDRLPPVRELGASLQVNMHTVRQAYTELQRLGLIEMRPGRGVTVLGTGDRHTLRQLASQLVKEARRVGLTTQELIHLIEEHQ